MSTLLQLNTSLFSKDGQSSKLADQFVAGWQANNLGLSGGTTPATGTTSE